MKKDMQWKEELVTKGYFHKELNKAITPLKKADAKLRQEMHEMEFRLINRMDLRFSAIDQRFDQFDEVLRKHLDTVMGLADKVVVAHTNFEAESASIRHNYRHLEDRVKKVEVAFPQTEKVQAL